MCDLFHAAACPLAAIATIWYCLPLVVSITLVCAATRYEAMEAIVPHALRFAFWIATFLIGFILLMEALERFF